MVSVFLFVLGAIVGSFLNVVGLRWDKKNFDGRSHCPNCFKMLRWFELVPILSFLIQKGRCRNCGTRISYQYPLIELWTGLIFVTVPYILISLVVRWWLGGSAVDWWAGPILFAFFASVWLLSRGRAMGFGDAKLGLSVGFLLGAVQGFSAIILAFWIGALGSLTYLLLNKTGFIKKAKKLTMKSEVPFAPFIVVGAWLALVFDLDIFYVISF